MARTNVTGLAGPGFAADRASIDLNTGRQIDWDNVPAGYANSDGKKVLPAGKAVSEMADGRLVPRVDQDIVANPDRTAVGLLATVAVEGEKQAALTGYGVVIGGVVYTELLPDNADAEWDPTIIDELQAAGTGFAFEAYGDDRAS